MSARAFHPMFIYTVHELTSELNSRNPVATQSVGLQDPQPSKPSKQQGYLSSFRTGGLADVLSESVPRLRQARKLANKKLLSFITECIIFLYMAVFVLAGIILTLIINITDKQFAMRPVDVVQTANAKWSITQLPSSERAHVCQEQVSFCYNACRSVANTAVNFCNIRTMGWNCACSSGSGEKRVRHYEWPMEIAECHAALATCNDACMAKVNGNDRVACFTGCTTNYPCNTVEAPFSTLRVQSVFDKPTGYMPPTDNKDIELTIGMKFGADTPGMDDAEKRLQRTNDPGMLPKIVPRSADDDDGNADGISGKPRGAGAGGRDKNAGGSYRKNMHPAGGDGGRLVSAGAIEKVHFSVVALSGAAAFLLSAVSF
ncbi:hypothetical protein H4R99_007686 [Coemansia sp. RSA 1722]|nr:hypothetical protein H4R99_007686 [Coemansia sp. RSA 1722]